MPSSLEAKTPFDPYPLHVVILNWNLPGDTIACVRSIQQGALPGVTILIVDNASTDDSLSRFQKELGDSVAVIANRANLGFAGGVNTGIRRALAEGAQSILLLNNDTLVGPGLVAQLAATMRDIPGADIV